MKNVIIDTDIGDDADDVLALAFALQHPELNIAGITTVFKNTAARAKIARYTLDLYNRQDIPVGVGVGLPIHNIVDTTEIPCQFLPAMAQVPEQLLTAENLYEQILSKQKCTIVSIGPLTNIANIITRQTHLLNRIEEIIIMGGCYYQHCNEWNIVCDPEAADIVFRSGLALRCVGLDVTRLCHLGPYLSGIDRNAGQNNFLLTMCDKWFEQTGYTPVLHDPLTILACLAEHDIQFREEQVVIELTGKYTRGTTFIGDYRVWGNTPANPNALVALNVNADRFVNYFVEKTFARK